MKLIELLNRCKIEGFESSYILQKYYKKELEFDSEKLTIFIKKFLKKLKKFEERTGIPKKYYSHKLNLSIFQNTTILGYVKIQDVYVYFDADVIFVRNKKIILKLKISNLKKNWLLYELDRIFNDQLTNNLVDQEEQILYLSKNFNIINARKIYIRYYLNCLYDVVFKYNNKYYCFYSDNFDEYAFTEEIYLSEKELLKIKRMLKINKLELKEKLNEKLNEKLINFPYICKK